MSKYFHHQVLIESTNIPTISYFPVVFPWQLRNQWLWVIWSSGGSPGMDGLLGVAGMKLILIMDHSLPCVKRTSFP
jgi:hypothetical protein